MDEEHKNEYGGWFLKHSQNKGVIQKTEPPKEEPEGEVQRNEMGYNTWFNNNSEGSVVINKSNEAKAPEEEQREEKHGDNYGD